MGLSPRVRGNQLNIRSDYNYPRSIPACTGEPSSRFARMVLSWVYPRVYGGTLVAGAIQIGTAGLSPRVRGNLRTRNITPP